MARELPARPPLPFHVHLIRTVVFLVLSPLALLRDGYRRLALFFSGEKTLQRGRESREERAPRVVIVGGSFAGLKAAQVLAFSGEILELVVIDRKEYLEYTPGILRTLVEPQHLYRLTCSLEYSVSKLGGRFVQGQVEAIGEKEVFYLTKEGEKRALSYDYLVITTGSSYIEHWIKPDPEPRQRKKASSRKTLDGGERQRMQEIMEAASELEQAERILIVGGGLVGVELAAEIADKLDRRERNGEQVSGKEVTLMSSTASLLPELPPAAGKEAERWLSSRGVNVRLNERFLEEQDDPTSKGTHVVLTSKGRKVTYDLVYKCLGLQPNSRLCTASNVSSNESGSFAPSPSAVPLSPEGVTLKVGKRGTINVDRCFRVQRVRETGDKRQNIFAAGDVVERLGGERENKSAHLAEVTAVCMALNLLSVLPTERGESGRRLRSYPEDFLHTRSSPLVAVCSLGKREGILIFNGLVFRHYFFRRLASLVKEVIEITKMMAAEGEASAILLWEILEGITETIHYGYEKVVG